MLLLWKSSQEPEMEFYLLKFHEVVSELFYRVEMCDVHDRFSVVLIPRNLKPAAPQLH